MAFPLRYPPGEGHDTSKIPETLSIRIVQEDNSNPQKTRTIQMHYTNQTGVRVTDLPDGRVAVFLKRHDHEGFTQIIGKPQDVCNVIAGAQKQMTDCPGCVADQLKGHVIVDDPTRKDE